MTRERLQQARTLLVLAQTGEDWGPVNDAALMLDAELALPEAREWRVAWDGGGTSARASQSIAEDRFLAVINSVTIKNPRIESRTPAGPWKKYEGPEAA